MPRGCAVVLAMVLVALSAAAGTETARRVYDASKLEVKVKTADDGNRYTHFNWEGLDHTAEVGAPELPVEYIRFLVPVYVKVTDVKVTTSPMLNARLMAPVFPVQQPQTTNQTAPAEFTPRDLNAYSTTYPVRAEYIDDGFMDGCNHLVTVAVYPVSYNPTSGTYQVASQIDVTLEYADCSEREMSSAPIFPPFQSKYLDLPSMVVNPEKASNLSYAPRKKATVKDNIRERYYIITPRNLADAFSDLVTWKRQKGYEVIVKNIEDVYADSRYAIGARYEFSKDTIVTVLDSAMSLRCYLRDEFKGHGHYFCLLAGDWRTPMPIRKATPGDSVFSYYDKETKVSYYNHVTNNCEDAIPTDAYFANLTKMDTLVKRKYMNILSVDNKSIDFNNSISIGRLLCATPVEVINYVNKVILYEGNPGYGDNSYLSSAMFFVGCGRYWNKEKQEFYHDGCNIIDSNIRLLRNYLTFFEKQYLFQDSYHAEKKGPLDEDAIKSKFEDGPSASEVIEYINNCGFSSWHAHGTPYGIACAANGHVIYPHDNMICSYPYNKNYHSYDKAGLNNLNNSNKPNFIFSVSCDNAPFDVYKWSENTESEFKFDKVNLGRALTTEYKSGAVGAIMNTRVGYIGVTSNIERTFFTEIKSNPKVGYSLREGILKNSRNWDQYVHDKLTLSLIGDPEFEMWLGKPKTMPIAVTAKKEGFEIIGNLNENAIVCINNGTDDFIIDGVNTDGSHFNNYSDGEYCVSIWNSGYLPIIKLIAYRGILESEKRYIVREAELGHENKSENISYLVGGGGKLSVRALDAIKVYSGFDICSDGIAELSCDQSISLNGGIVQSGGRLIIRAKDVKFGPGFKVMPGGILEINNN